MDINKEKEISKAMDKALTYLTASMRTERQIREYLKKKDVSESTQEKVIERLMDYGLINDTEYADLYVKLKAESKGKRRIAEFLSVKGVSENNITRAISEIGDQVEVAKRIAEKYMKNKENTTENISKLFRHLLYKGFEYETVNTVIKEFRSRDE